MIRTVFTTRALVIALISSVALGALFASLPLAGAGPLAGTFATGWPGFSFLFLLSFLSLYLLYAWAANQQLAATNSLAILLALAFFIRLGAGTTLHFALPIDGYDDPDDQAGYVFTDAHRRDAQAWELANSDQPILSAFDRSFHTDQYGGLLALCSLIYRFLSPDAQRPLMLILLSAFVAALGVPFLWRSARTLWGEKVAIIATWIYVLYPESILLGGAAMREPYLMTFSAMALWGFVTWHVNGASAVGRDQGDVDRQTPTHNRQLPTGYWSLATGLLGMLLVSPVVALVTLMIFAGWTYLASERGRISWWAVAVAAVVFVAGLLLLSSSLNRQGSFDSSSPIGVLGGFLREAVKWDVYQLERGSGWVQKLFDEMPAWLRLPFVTIYGVFQPVLPAAIVEPTTLTWKIIAITRALGWYALLPALVLALLARPASGGDPSRPTVPRDAAGRVVLWITIVCWLWILLTSLRGGGDQWDNPRYRAILFMWQAVVAGYALAGLAGGVTAEGEDRGPSTAGVGPWFLRFIRTPAGLRFAQIIFCELIFLAIFTQWYASRYYHWGGQLPFAVMIGLILGLWAIVIIGGWLWARKSKHNP